MPLTAHVYATKATPAGVLPTRWREGGGLRYMGLLAGVKAKLRDIIPARVKNTQSVSRLFPPGCARPPLPGRGAHPHAGPMRPAPDRRLAKRHAQAERPSGWPIPENNYFSHVTMAVKAITPTESLNDSESHVTAISSRRDKSGNALRKLSASAPPEWALPFRPLMMLPTPQ